MSMKIAKLIMCVGLDSHAWQDGLRVYRNPNGEIYRVTVIRKCRRCDRGPETFHMGRWSGFVMLLDTHYVECWKGDALYEAALSWAKKNYTNRKKMIYGPEGLF